MALMGPAPIALPPECVARGRDAYLAGIPNSHNPYPPGTIFYDSWLKSWAQEEEEAEESIYALIQQRGRGK